MRDGDAARSCHAILAVGWQAAPRPISPKRSDTLTHSSIWVVERVKELFESIAIVRIAEPVTVAIEALMIRPPAVLPGNAGHLRPLPVQLTAERLQVEDGRLGLPVQVLQHAFSFDEMFAAFGQIWIMDPQDLERIPDAWTRSLVTVTGGDNSAAVSQGARRILRSPVFTMLLPR